MAGKRRHANHVEEEDDEEEEAPVVETAVIEKPRGKQKAKKRARFDDADEISDLSQSDICLREAEVGIVERVFVTNFMCHKTLEVRLGSNVNFIIGRNGSGKSAILTAIIVGLGGKAATTSRGSSLKGFIKEGCHACHISITLRNQKKDAYKNAEYGDSIVVERKITQDGYGHYKIKSKDGKVISQKREELVNILDHFNIQIDNPVSILTQDTSRSFLNTSNPKDKYAFFLKATQLERLTDDYQKIIQEKALTKDLLDRKKKVIPDLGAEVKIHEEKYNDMQQLQKMKKKIHELKKEISWAYVNDSRKALESKEKNSNKCKAKLPRCEKKIQDSIDKVQELNDQFEEKRDELASFQENVTSLINEKDELSLKLRKQKEELKRSENDCRKIDREINTAQRDRKSLQDEIENIKNTAQKDFEAERIAREAELNEKMEAQQQLKSKLSVTSSYYNQIERNIQEKNKQKNELQNSLRDKDKEIDKRRRQIHEMEAQVKNKLAVFGENTANILKTIDDFDRQGKFHRKPIGPLGSLISLKDHKWAWSVEECLKGMMYSYACHDNHDMKILKEIFKRANANSRYRSTPSIILSAFSDQLYDVSNNVPGPRFFTVMNALNFDNPIVTNTFIDQGSIETVLLIEDARKAQDVLWNDQFRPPHSYKAFTLEGHQVIGGRMSKIYTCNKRHQKFFRHDIAGSMREIETEIQDLQNAKNIIRENINRITADIRQDEAEKKRTQRKRMEEQDMINNINMEIQEIQQCEEDKAPDIATFETELAEIEDKLVKLEESRQVYEAKVIERRTEKQRQDVVLNECVERCGNVYEELETMQNKQADLETQLRESKGHKRYYQEQLEKLNREIENCQKDVETAQADFEKTYKQATDYCEEVETQRSIDTIDSEIKIAQRRIDREESIRGNADDIIEKYHSALQRYKTAKDQYDNCRKNLMSIERAMERRVNRFREFRRFISHRSREHFNMLLSQRGYVGRITFDHENEQLNIKVNVENQKGANVSDSRALSGGERSFSTICFVMALWDAMEAPFRCLDEFDVFMDMLNRRISMKMLLKIAKEQISRQFILLTPQDMSDISQSDRVRIFKLSDPERGQQTIDFERQE